MLRSPSHADHTTGIRRSYVRFAALGDSATFGLGDRRGEECRGWARLLVTAMRREHDVSFCNAAVPGARVEDVYVDQLPLALAHRPHLASLIVGINDVVHANWDPHAVRLRLLECAEALDAQGALLMTARFHDHARVFRLPGVLAKPMRARIQALNAAYDEIHGRFGGIVLDLSAHPGIYEREFWSVDRLHPSELGHRALADEFAAQLAEVGLTFDPPGLTLDGPPPSRAAELDTIVNEVLPWVGRRLRGLAPVVLRSIRNSPARRRRSATGRGALHRSTGHRAAATALQVGADRFLGAVLPFGVQGRSAS
jgi:lysophospholipase L1-like esterase